MNRKTLLKALAALALAPAVSGVARAEGPLGDPTTSAERPVRTAGRLPFARPATRDQWREVADRAARDVVQTLGSFQKVHVAPAKTDSAFEQEFRQLLVNSLDEMGLFVMDVPAREARVIEIAASITPREKSGATLPKMVKRYATEAVEGRAVSGDAAVVPSADVAVTLTIKAGDVYLMRRTHEFNVATGDIHLYKKAAPVMRVVGEK